ncbi:MAG TPA: tripartite tricarboxylate transporter substrate-binding protein, partial [Burkholderiales bacterium]|nr:tripartite tricarboxylate transporter substrate-binding protein [Burkholderiales bacterium]
LLGGQIPAGIANVPALLPLVQSARLRALAVTGAQRFAQWPSVPTMAESGMPGYDVTSWYGVCAPAGTPRPVIEKVNAGLSAVLRAPDVQQRMNEMVIDAAPTSPEAFAAFIRAETDRWAKVVKDAGITQQ